MSNLLRLLIKVTEVTTEHQKWPKVSQKSIKSPFFARRAKNASDGGRSPPQELEVSPRSGLYLLMFSKSNPRQDSEPESSCKQFQQDQGELEITQLSATNLQTQTKF